MPKKAKKARKDGEPQDGEKLPDEKQHDGDEQQPELDEKVSKKAKKAKEGPYTQYKGQVIPISAPRKLQRRRQTTKKA